MTIPQLGQICLPRSSSIIDSHGHALDMGTIHTCEPGSYTPKTTWMDAKMEWMNPNPITLDHYGRALPIFGIGEYRIIVKDQYDNLIYDQSVTVVHGEVTFE